MILCIIFFWYFIWRNHIFYKSINSIFQNILIKRERSSRFIMNICMILYLCIIHSIWKTDKYIYNFFIRVTNCINDLIKDNYVFTNKSNYKWDLVFSQLKIALYKLVYNRNGSRYIPTNEQWNISKVHINNCIYCVIYTFFQL